MWFKKILLNFFIFQSVLGNHLRIHNNENVFYVKKRNQLLVLIGLVLKQSMNLTYSES